MCKRKSRPSVVHRSKSAEIVIKSYHVSERTAEAIQRLSFETGMTEGQVVDKILRTHLATEEFIATSGKCTYGGECLSGC